MRLALVVPSFPKLSETFVVQKVRGLLDHGWDVHVVCANSDEADWQHFPQLTCLPDIRSRVHKTLPASPRWRRAATVPAAMLRRAAFNPLCSLRYTRKAGIFRGLRMFPADEPLLRLKPDAVHFVFGALAVERSWIKEALGCRLSVSFRGYDLTHSQLDKPDAYDAVWCDADQIHVLSDGLAELAYSRGCPEEKPLLRIPPAVELARFEPGLRRHTDWVGKPGSRPLQALSVGRLEWVKGYPYALLALRELRDQRGVEVRYRIIGDGAALEEIAFARRQLGLEDSVDLLGALPPAAIPSAMRQADVLLHPAVAEGFGNAPLEAQAMRLPVVCTDAVGLPENVVDGETGYVVPRRDPEALADALERLLDPAERERLGQAGRKRVQAHFSYTAQAQAWHDYFTRLLGHP